MESIPLISQSTANNLPPSTQSVASSNTVRPLPAEVMISPEGDSIVVNGSEYQLKLANAQQRQQLITANTFLLVPDKASVSASTQLIALAGPLTLKVPDTVINLAQQNGISLAQLNTLAARSQGYVLPNVTVNNAELQFSNGTILAADNGSRLVNGEYLAKIVISQNRLTLMLTPVISRLDISIGSKIDSLNLIADKQAANVVIAKAEPAQIINQFFKKLESITVQNEGAKNTSAKTADILANATTNLGAKPTANAASNTQNANAATAANLSTVMVPNAANAGLSSHIALNLSQALSPDSVTNQTPAPSNTELAQGKMAVNNGAQNNTPVNTLDKTVKVQDIHSSAAQTTAQNRMTTNSPQGETPAVKASLSTAMNLNAASPQSDKPSLGVNTQTLPPAAGIKNPDLSQTTTVDVLQKAFTKAGALPPEQLSVRPPENLATELLKHFPSLGPQPLSRLADPDVNRADILGLAALNLASPQTSGAALLLNGGAISSLFQLLLGVKANQKISTKLANYLEQLQARSGFSSKQLGQLNKAGGLETMAQLASSLHLYQQASSDNNGNLTWFFALPYSISQRHEQLEGKFERGNQDDDQQKNNGWKLQLKFNLTQGPLLICAQHHQQLDIQFKGNNQLLLNKVERFLTPLSQKLTQLGFAPGELSTQIAQVPATLLPGDHFLIKTKA